MIFYGKLKIDGVTCFLGDQNEAMMSKADVRDSDGDPLPRDLIRYIPSNLRNRPPVTVEEFFRRIAVKVGGLQDQIYMSLLVSGVNPSKKLTEIDTSELAMVYVSSLFLGKVKLSMVGDLFSKVDEPFRPFLIKQTSKVLRKVSGDSLVFLSSSKYLGFCDKVFVGARGEMMEESDGREFYHPYSKVIMDSALRIGTVGQRAPIRYSVVFSDVGCSFHDSCELSRQDRELRRKCVLEKPKLLRVKENRVKCWYFEKVE